MAFATDAIARNNSSRDDIAGTSAGIKHLGFLTKSEHRLWPMKTRAIWIYSTMAFAGCLFGGAAALWIESSNPPSVASHRLLPFSMQHVSSGDEVSISRAQVPKPLRHLRLRLSPMNSLADRDDAEAPEKHNTVGTSSTSPQDWSAMDSLAERYMQPERKLDLALPPAARHEAGPVAVTGVHGSPVSETNSASSAITPSNLNLGVTPDVASDSDDSDSPDKLFNRNNGLRGFMAKNWLNQHVGVQGGLAIREERLREEDSDLQDNVAVGMGVLLAF